MSTEDSQTHGFQPNRGEKKKSINVYKCCMHKSFGTTPKFINQGRGAHIQILTTVTSSGLLIQDFLFRFDHGTLGFIYI